MHYIGDQIINGALVLHPPLWVQQLPKVYASVHNTQTHMAVVQGAICTQYTDMAVVQEAICVEDMAESKCQSYEG